MASYRYTRDIRPEDLQPEPVHQMTPAEKRRNFWYYNKRRILIALAVLAVVGYTVWQQASQVQPDYQVGLLSSRPVTAAASQLLEQVLEQACDDRNGDGQVAVQLSVYELASDTPEEVMAGTARLAGDTQANANAFFLVDDLTAFSNETFTGLFADEDGRAVMEPGGAGWAGLGTAWADCPALAQALAGAQQALEGAAGSQEAELYEELYGALDQAAEYLQSLRLVPCARPAEAGEDDLAYFEASAALIGRLTGQSGEAAP